MLKPLVRTSVKVHEGDWNRLLRKLRPEYLAPPLDDLMTAVAEHVRDQVPLRFPSPTGASVRSTNKAYGFYTARSVRLSERHALILNFGGRGKKSRWRVGRVGKRTKGWFFGIVRLVGVKRKVNELLNKARAQLEARWRA